MVTASDNVSATHPEYDKYRPDWRQMRDTFSGQRAVKEAGQLYLPPTGGMILDGMGYCGAEKSKGQAAYDAYLMRALFHAFVKDAVQTMLGMLWNKESVYTLPDSMKYLMGRASIEGDGLKQLHRRIHQEQLITGRLGLLADAMPKGKGVKPDPYIALYTAESIKNWDAGFRGDTPVETVNLVVLDESGPERTGIFMYEDVEQHRVLVLGDPIANESDGVYRYGVFKDEESFDMSLMKTPIFNAKSLTFIPFTFITCNSVTDTIPQPPLMGLSDLDLALYRLEADYRLALYQQTQDTLFTKGFADNANEAIRIGVGGRIHSPQSKGDAKFIGVTSKGLPEMRTAIENDSKAAASKAGELMDPSSRARESGTALEMRIGSKTATMNEIAISSAEGLQQTLRHIGRMRGLSESQVQEITVQPNMRFTSMEFSALELKDLTEAKMNGAAVSFRSMHKWAVSRGYTTLDFDEMVEEIKNEMDLTQEMQPDPTPLEQEQLNIEQQKVDIQQQVADKPVPKPAAAPARK